MIIVISIIIDFVHIISMIGVKFEREMYGNERKTIYRRNFCSNGEKEYRFLFTSVS